MSTARHLVGVDEAGRGPLAGPVAVGVALVPVGFDWNQLPKVNDSKQLTETQRTTLFQQATVLRRQGKLDFAVAQISARLIDEKGIVPAIRLATDRALRRIQKDGISWSQVSVKLDGGLQAPSYCEYQETIIKGDSKEKVIGLASIVAKVTRDAYMMKQANKSEFAVYNFSQHKGYGTKSHRELIQTNGLSTLHRASYCKNIELL